MGGKIMIPMYILWLHGLYGLYGPRCPLTAVKFNHSLTRKYTIKELPIWSGENFSEMCPKYVFVILSLDY